MTFCPLPLCQRALNQACCSCGSTFPVPHTLFKYVTTRSLPLGKSYKWMPKLWEQEITPSFFHYNHHHYCHGKAGAPHWPCPEQGFPPPARVTLQCNEAATFALAFAVLDRRDTCGRDAHHLKRYPCCFIWVSISHMLILTVVTPRPPSRTLCASACSKRHTCCYHIAFISPLNKKKKHSKFLLIFISILFELKA